MFLILPIAKKWFIQLIDQWVHTPGVASCLAHFTTPSPGVSPASLHAGLLCIQITSQQDESTLLKPRTTWVSPWTLPIWVISDNASTAIIKTSSDSARIISSSGIASGCFASIKVILKLYLKTFLRSIIKK